ncbi:MAG: agmatinase [Caldimicrobium thiodismutans]|uniref:Agmatinase n=1 Tax=Caldimicrobium thiodismutans TaxID=1653476 RepID=A0A2N7PIF2_9BACT|nr:MAG: agmatinase [Caldimicrobium thiodismutans]PMP62608.1 MAG: agmatinase [Caldimicrobium thiodismutans]
MKLSFLGLPDHPKARVALIPVPFELTTTWLKGTKEAPFEILKVSAQLEFFDEETRSSPQEDLGFYTYPLEEFPLNVHKALEKIEDLTHRALKEKFFPILVGGEHTITYGAVKALKAYYPDLKVLHLDAHLDFRKTYLEDEFNHATVLRKIYELSIPTLSVGIRAISKEEFEEAEFLGLSIIYSYEIYNSFERVLKKIEEFLKEGSIYLTLDMDVLDPSLAPGVGTPEPGGLLWFQILEILKRVSQAKIVGLDIVETRPISGYPFTEFLAAKIIYKFSAYLTVYNKWIKKSES